MPTLASTSGIDSDLVATYLRDHRELLASLREVRASAAAGDGARAFAGLQGVRKALQRHVLSENVNLYAQLERTWRTDPDKGRTITLFRIEMEAIGKSALQFFEKYSSEVAMRQAGALFLSDLDEVGVALAKRIDDEEKKLYPLCTGA